MHWYIYIYIDIYCISLFLSLSLLLSLFLSLPLLLRIIFSFIIVLLSHARREQCLASSTLVASRSQVCCDNQYEALISKCKLQIGCCNKLAISLQLMQNRLFARVRRRACVCFRDSMRATWPSDDVRRCEKGRWGAIDWPSEARRYGASRRSLGPRPSPPSLALPASRRRRTPSRFRPRMSGEPRVSAWILQAEKNERERTRHDLTARTTSPTYNNEQPCVRRRHRRRGASAPSGIVETPTCVAMAANRSKSPIDPKKTAACHALCARFLQWGFISFFRQKARFLLRRSWTLFDSNRTSQNDIKTNEQNDVNDRKVTYLF